MSDRHYFAELIRDRRELDRAIDFILYRIAHARLDPCRFVWSCEPFFWAGYRILAVEFPG